MGSAKADFLRIRDALGLDPAALRLLAPMLGFAPPPKDAWQEQPVVDLPSQEDSTGPDGAKGSELAPFTKVPFFRLDHVEHEDPPTDDDEEGPEPSAEPFTLADIAPLRNVDYRETPLQTEWPQLWPILFELICEKRFGHDVDTDALVQAVCRLDPLEYVPHRSWSAWPQSLTLLIDRSTRLLPMWTDQTAVKRGLQTLLGEANVCAIDLGTGLPQPEDQDTSICLALTDLGAKGSAGERAWWQREGQRRMGLGQRICALMPLPPEVCASFASPWSRAAWSPAHAWCPDQSDAARRARVHKLLTLLVPAHRVDHGLVRELRQQLGLRAGDLQTELDVWSRPELEVGGGLAAAWRPDAIASLRPDFQRPGRYEDKVLAVQLLKAWHGAVFARDVWPEELAGLRELTCDDPELKRAINEVLAEALQPLDVLGSRLFATMKSGDPEVARPLAAWLRAYAQRAPSQVFHNDGKARDQAGEYNPWFAALWAAPTLQQGAVVGGGLEARDLRRLGKTQETNLLSHQTARGLQFGEEQGSPVANLKSEASAFVLRRPGQFDQRHAAEDAYTWAISPADLPRPLPEPVPDWADRADRDRYGRWAEVDIKGVALKMRWIEPGTFWMGSPEDEKGRDDDEGPRHQVTLTEGYWMAETPCTQALWRAVTGESPSEFKGEQRPVERVSWNDIQRFIRTIETLVPGLELCLPTEAEWENSCRAGSEQARYGELDDIAWFDDNSRHQTHQVRTKLPNAWGLYDTLGNVWEWCHDSMQSYGHAHAIDPIGPMGGTLRVLRGGSWRDSARDVRAACRFAYDPSLRLSGVGFRLSRGPSALMQEEAGGHQEQGVRPGPGGTSGQGAEPRGSRPSQTVESGIVLITDRAQARLGFFERPEWASYAGRDKYGLFCEVEVEAVKETVMPVRFKMRWIPPGQFMMGSPESEEGRFADETQHLVTLTEGYWMADTPCTQELWTAVMDKNPSHVVGDEHPVENISWDMTREFFQALDLRLPGMNLPTEAQWENACRAGTEGPCYGKLNSVAWHDANAGGVPHAVAGKAPNAWGLYDTLGNVWEWCHDRMHSYGHAHAIDPIGPMEGTERVLRGGSWNVSARGVRAAYRFAYAPSFRRQFVGFRLSRGQSVPSRKGR